MSGRLKAATASLAGAAVMITVVTFASRIVGFGRYLVQGAVLGTEQTSIAQPFNSANNLPNVLFEVAAGGALAGAVIPLLAGPIVRGRKEETSKIASALLGWTLAVLVPIGALVVVFADPISHVFGLENPEQIAVAATFLRVFALQIPLYGLAVVLGGVLQAHKRFFWPAFAPLLSSLVVIGVYLVFGTLAHGDENRIAELSTMAIQWLAWGTTAGVAALAVPLVWPTHRAGVRLRPTLRFPGGEGRRAVRLASAGILALVAQQAFQFLSLRLATKYGEHGTLYIYTQQVYLLPYAVLAFPLATSTFPRMAEHAAAGRRAEFHRLISSSTRALLAVMAVGVAMVAAAAGPIQGVFGSIVDGPVGGMQGGLVAMAPGLLGYALILHLSRTLYMIDRQRSAVLATATGWVVAILASTLAARAFAPDDTNRVLPVLGCATALGMTVAGCLLLLAVRRSAGTAALRGLGRTVIALVVGAAAGGSVGMWLSDRLLPPAPSLLVALAVGVVVAVLAAAIAGGAILAIDRSAILGLLRDRRPDDHDARTSGESGNESQVVVTESEAEHGRAADDDT